MCNAAAHSPLKFPQSHFNPVYKLKAMRETKMENIAAAVKRLAVQKAYFYLCHATQVTTNIFCWPGALPSGKQRITPTLSHLSITHGNLNCHNKVFFQDLSSNSLSFLLKWLSRVSRKSRGRIVIRNRWSPNHRWCRGEGWEGKGGRTAGGKQPRPPEKQQQVLFCPWRVSISVTELSETVGFIFLTRTVNGTFLISSRGEQVVPPLPLGGEPGLECW